MFRSFIFVLALIVVGVAPSSVPQKKIILPPGTTAGGNYSPGIMVDGTLYISGQGVRMRRGKYQASSKPR